MREDWQDAVVVLAERGRGLQEKFASELKETRTESEMQDGGARQQVDCGKAASCGRDGRQRPLNPGRGG